MLGMAVPTPMVMQTRTVMGTQTLDVVSAH